LFCAPFIEFQSGTFAIVPVFAFHEALIPLALQILEGIPYEQPARLCVFPFNFSKE